MNSEDVYQSNDIHLRSEQRPTEKSSKRTQWKPKMQSKGHTVFFGRELAQIEVSYNLFCQVYSKWNIKCGKLQTISTVKQSLNHNRVFKPTALTCPTDDYYLLTFLRAAKFDYDKAYERLLHYHTVRAKNWDVYMVI